MSNNWSAVVQTEAIPSGRSNTSKALGLCCSIMYQGESEVLEQPTGWCSNPRSRRPKRRHSL